MKYLNNILCIRVMSFKNSRDRKKCTYSINDTPVSNSVSTR